MDLIVTDGHEGLLAAVSALFAATPRQRCVVQKQRNVLNAIPKRERQEVATELLGIWKQEKKEEALLNLVVSELRTEKLISGTLDAEILLSFVRRLLVSMPSRLQVDQGKLVVVLRARPFLPWQSEAGDNSVIHQRQSRNGRLSRSFRSHASNRSVV